MDDGEGVLSSARDDDGGGFIARDARAAREIATKLLCD